jgi:hypothetical protein
VPSLTSLVVVCGLTVEIKIHMALLGALSWTRTPSPGSVLSAKRSTPQSRHLAYATRQVDLAAVKRLAITTAAAGVRGVVSYVP